MLLVRDALIPPEAIPSEKMTSTSTDHSDPQALVALTKRINVVWDHAGRFPEHRYVPLSVDNQGGWVVWDRRQQCVMNATALLALPLDAIENERLPN
jgi:hypothetical protein